MQEESYKKIGIYILFSIAIALILVSLTANPYVISKLFSADGSISATNKFKIYIFETVTLGMGLIVLLLYFIKNSSSEASKKIERNIYLFCYNHISKIVLFIFVAILLLTFSLRIPIIKTKWLNAKGGEYFWIAKSLAKGKGYSFESKNRWLFVDFKSKPTKIEYFATAWEEPIYPLIMSINLKLFGKYGKLAIIIFQNVSFLLTAVLIIFLGWKIFNLQTGLIAGVILAKWPSIHSLAERSLGPHMFAGLIICLSAIITIWCMDRLSFRRAVLLGLILGFGCLTFSATVLFIPLIALLFLFSKNRFNPNNWKISLAVIFGAIIIMTPWTLRNLITFGHFIPLKNGLGQITHASNPILESTYSSEKSFCSKALGAIWEAKDAKEAIRNSSKDFAKRLQINRRGFECIEIQAPPGYETFNEAERDKVYLAQTVKFIYSRPRTFLSLTYHRIMQFFRGWNNSQLIVTLLALLGAFAAIKNYKARFLILMPLAYSVPFWIATPYFYRYRYAIEPILILLASFCIVFFCSKIYHWLKRFRIIMILSENMKKLFNTSAISNH